MSSPINFPDSDVDMQEHESAEQSMPDAPPRQPLFDLGTPSTSRGTPRKSAVPSTPGIMARRALGMSTPRSAPRTPLFEGTVLGNSQGTETDRCPSGKFVSGELSELTLKEDPKDNQTTIRFRISLIGPY